MKNIEIHYPLVDLIKSCETYCEAICCDIDAFNISSSIMEGWIEEAGLNGANIALRQIDELVNEVISQECNVFSEVLNYSWAPSEFVKYFKNWAIELKKAIVSYERFYEEAHKFFKINNRIGITDKCAKIMIRLEKESLNAEDLADDEYIGLSLSGSYRYQFLQEFMFHLENLRLKGIIHANSGKYELTEYGRLFLKNARKKGIYSSIIGK
jgi:hypothetical protein